jgi:hypothetical protein
MSKTGKLAWCATLVVSAGSAALAYAGANTKTSSTDPPGTPATSAAQTTGKKPGSQTQQPKTRSKAAHSSYKPDRFAGRARQYYEVAWGIDSLSVKLMESSELVRFTYRVIDPAKAALLNDKQNEASLIDPRARVSLSVPTMEKVGQLRQSVPPEVGRVYWMAFSNKGRLVKRGDRVDVVIGQRFHASNLVVD